MSFKKIIFVTVTATALTGIFSAAVAAPNNDLYVGLDAQHWNYDENGFDSQSSMSLRMRAGTNFSEYIGAEVHLGLGGDDTVNANGFDIKFELDLLMSAFVKGKLPVTSDFRLYGLAGVSYLEATASNAFIKYTADDTNFAAGLGLEFDITPHVSIGGDVIRHSFGASGYDFDTMSAGVTYRF